MICPTCEAAMVGELILTGGCSGHPEGSYCYCDSADVHMEFRCPNSTEHYEYRNKKKGSKGEEKKILTRIPPTCKQRVVKFGTLGDQYAIARWIVQHFEPTEKDIPLMKKSDGYSWRNVEWVPMVKEVG